MKFQIVPPHKAKEAIIEHNKSEVLGIEITNKSRFIKTRMVVIA